MGFDLEAFLDQPLGYSQSNGTIELRERIAAIYPGADVDHIEVTNGTSEANYLVALSQLRPGDDVRDGGAELHADAGRRAQPRRRRCGRFSLRQDTGWEPDWDEFERAVTPRTRLLYLSNPNNPTGSVLSRRRWSGSSSAARRPARGCWPTRSISAPRSTGERTTSFWGMSDRVIVTSGLSKAYGIPGVRIGWIVGPRAVVADCWTQHDYLTIGPNKMSDRHRAGRRRAAESRALLRADASDPHAQPADRAGVDRRSSAAASRGASRRPAPSRSCDTRRRSRASNLPSASASTRARSSSPASHVGLEGYLRIWLGGREDFLREGLRRIGNELKALAVNRFQAVAAARLQHSTLLTDPALSA